jgi:hypothetical protein
LNGWWALQDLNLRLPPCEGLRTKETKGLTRNSRFNLVSSENTQQSLLDLKLDPPETSPRAGMLALVEPTNRTHTLRYNLLQSILSRFFLFGISRI